MGNNDDQQPQHSRSVDDFGKDQKLIRLSARIQGQGFIELHTKKESSVGLKGLFIFCFVGLRQRDNKKKKGKRKQRRRANTRARKRDLQSNINKMRVNSS